jgi:hypothetical protein
VLAVPEEELPAGSLEGRVDTPPRPPLAPGVGFFATGFGGGGGGLPSREPPLGFGTSAGADPSGATIPMAFSVEETSVESSTSQAAIASVKLSNVQ